MKEKGSTYCRQWWKQSRIGEGWIETRIKL